MLPDDLFTDAPLDFRSQVLLDGLLEVRRDLLVDPLLASPWSCDPDRCRPRLGPHLCCKVQRRCPHLVEGRCGIHGEKPFACELFPLDLVRFGGVRVVTTVKNLDFFHTGWSRYDRDMLRCFDGAERSSATMFEAQRSLLERVFTRAEVAVMDRALTRLRRFAAEDAEGR